MDLARDIKLAYPGLRGFSVRNLKYMLRFAREYPNLEIVQPLAAQIPWTSHIVLLDKVQDPAIRAWYAQQAAENQWSRRGLIDRIDRRLFD
ncbi:MAG: DUF1016 N-terminal domain-containing protein [Propionibacteriaceae bacterium]|nr:DUF1016 N-terminal domain-containing protein [Propionibacteriaceae bacterium]